MKLQRYECWDPRFPPGEYIGLPLRYGGSEAQLRAMASAALGASDVATYCARLASFKVERQSRGAHRSSVVVWDSATAWVVEPDHFASVLATPIARTANHRGEEAKTMPTQQQARCTFAWLKKSEEWGIRCEGDPPDGGTWGVEKKGGEVEDVEVNECVWEGEDDDGYPVSLWSIHKPEPKRRAPARREEQPRRQSTRREEQPRRQSARREPEGDEARANRDEGEVF
jgi:hypothetical protein